jgi:hypothetical protein
MRASVRLQAYPVFSIVGCLKWVMEGTLCGENCYVPRSFQPSYGVEPVFQVAPDLDMAFYNLIQTNHKRYEIQTKRTQNSLFQEEGQRKIFQGITGRYFRRYAERHVLGREAFAQDTSEDG